jgi:hypothetical protein
MGKSTKRSTVATPRLMVCDPLARTLASTAANAGGAAKTKVATAIASAATIMKLPHGVSPFGPRVFGSSRHQ